MKNILIAMSFFLTANLAHANCAASITLGQVKQDCNNEQTSSTYGNVEYSQIPYNRTQDKQNIASLEHTVEHAYITQSNFKPTHTQLNQVKQLLNYAERQGCKWGGKHDQPTLICPE